MLMGKAAFSSSAVLALVVVVVVDAVTVIIIKVALFLTPFSSLNNHGDNYLSTVAANTERK